jgi:anthranilate phosphoribosyltransferase
MDILKGKAGSQRDIVLFNSGAAIYAANKTKTIGEGVELARESIDSGKALEKLEMLKVCSHN